MDIPITRPSFTDAEEKALLEVLASGWVSQGPKVAEFEGAFAASIGARYAVATSSCTTALHLVLAALGIGPGDEVVVPALTYVATANVVEYQGARPVFVDVDLKTFNLDPDRLEERITKRTKAIIPVHLFGLAADMDPILDIARRRHLLLIEDAACAVRSLYRGKPAGTFGIAGCFSFHPRKVITTGEGGMVVTEDRRLARKLQVLRSHGAAVSDLDRHRGKGFVLPVFDVVGYNYRMTDLQAALGTVQLQKADQIVGRRRHLAKVYTEAFRELPGLLPPTEPEGFFHTYQSYILLLASGRRDPLAGHLEKSGIAVRQGTHAVHALGYYRRRYGLKAKDFPRAWRADRDSLTLPLYPQMTEAEQGRVIEAVRATVGRWSGER